MSPRLTWSKDVPVTLQMPSLLLQAATVVAPVVAPAWVNNNANKTEHTGRNDAMRDAVPVVAPAWVNNSLTS